MGNRENPVSSEGSHYKALLEVATALGGQPTFTRFLRDYSLLLSNLRVRINRVNLEEVFSDIRIESKLALHS